MQITRDPETGKVLVRIPKRDPVYDPATREEYVVELIDDDQFAALLDRFAEDSDV